jgi:hypothetical protein
MTNIIVLCLALSILIFNPCAAAVPTRNYPLQFQKAYHVPIDKAWDAVVQLIKDYQGTIICNDKDSGYLSFLFTVKGKESSQRYYVNVYITSGLFHTTMIYLVPYSWQGRSIEEIDKEIYEKVDAIVR